MLANYTIFIYDDRFTACTVRGSAPKSTLPVTGGVIKSCVIFLPNTPMAVASAFSLSRAKTSRSIEGQTPRYSA